MGFEAALLARARMGRSWCENPDYKFQGPVGTTAPRRRRRRRRRRWAVQVPGPTECGVPERFCHDIGENVFSRCLASQPLLRLDRLYFTRTLTRSWGSWVRAEKDTSHRHVEPSADLVCLGRRGADRPREWWEPTPPADPGSSESGLRARLACGGRAPGYSAGLPGSSSDCATV